MKSDELLDAIGEAKDEYVQDVRNAKVKKMPGWAKWTSAIAACLVLALGLNMFFNMGGNAGSGPLCPDGHLFNFCVSYILDVFVLRFADGVE